MTTQQCPPKKSECLRILHTSDWHLGKRLYHQSRYDEFEAFLTWLLSTINQRHIDIVIVAGDIFDTMTPSNHAQTLYYQFLAKIIKTCCQHVIIIAGNHDSPSFLEAPKTILTSLNIQVIGTASDNPNDELITLYNQQHIPIAIIVAVPYLRDKDIRTSSHGDTISDKEQQTKLAITKHYQVLASLAKHTRQKLQTQYHVCPPIIATGHLFVAGATISSKDDGMRQLYIGTLGQMSTEIFDDCFDYVALGHIHATQMIGNQSRIRYSGSPIAMGFAEAHKTKNILVVDFDGQTPSIYPITVPVFQSLKRIEGDWQSIQHALEQLIQSKQSVWVEIIYTGRTLEPNLVAKIRDKLANTQVQALNIQNKTLYQTTLKQNQPSENLSHLSPTQVFERLMMEQELSPQEKHSLQAAYQSLLSTISQTDDLP